LKPVSTINGVAVCLLRENIDTDTIIPSREIRSVSKSGLGPSLFANWRYRDTEKRELAPEFVLNVSRYRGARILLTGANFGCGSSREHAVWALQDYGFNAVVAPSFGRIFHDNCINNGLLPVILDEQSIQSLAAQVEEPDAAPMVRINLPDQTVTGPAGTEYHFEFSSADKEMLISGLDQIAATECHGEAIRSFRQKDRKERPWAYL
jgi:3-isopropylmalate/(R)-2-methylmalate dehydratase small subunit